MANLAGAGKREQKKPREDRAKKKDLRTGTRKAANNAEERELQNNGLRHSPETLADRSCI